MSSRQRPSATLQNEEIFNSMPFCRFEHRLTEAVLPFSPIPRIKFHLNPKDHYRVFFRVEQHSNKRLLYQNDEWIETSEKTVDFKNKLIHLGSKFGKEWMKNDVNLDFNTTASGSHKSKKTMFLQHFVLYQLVIVVVEKRNEPGTRHHQKIETTYLKIPELQFVPVNRFLSKDFIRFRKVVGISKLGCNISPSKIPYENNHDHERLDTTSEESSEESSEEETEEDRQFKEFADSYIAQLNDFHHPWTPRNQFFQR